MLIYPPRPSVPRACFREREARPTNWPAAAPKERDFLAWLPPWPLQGIACPACRNTQVNRSRPNGLRLELDPTRAPAPLAGRPAGEAACAAAFCPRCRAAVATTGA